MDTKHTPGPWTYRAQDFHDNCPTEHFISAPTRGRICRLSSPDAEGKANAALISAAPDLLEALKVLLSQVSPKAREFPRMFGPVEIAEAAIAKAEGTAVPVEIEGDTAEQGRADAGRDCD